MALTIKSAFTEKSGAEAEVDLPNPFSHGKTPESCWTLLDPKTFPMAERTVLLVLKSKQCLALPYRQIKYTALKGISQIVLMGSTHKVTIEMEDARQVYRHVFCGESLIVYEWQWRTKPKRASDQVRNILVEKLGVPPKDSGADATKSADGGTEFTH